MPAMTTTARMAMNMATTSASHTAYSTPGTCAAMDSSLAFSSGL
jgi:hypothetical protein